MGSPAGCLGLEGGGGGGGGVDLPDGVRSSGFNWRVLKPALSLVSKGAENQHVWDSSVQYTKKKALDVWNRSAIVHVKGQRKSQC